MHGIFIKVKGFKRIKKEACCEHASKKTLGKIPLAYFNYVYITSI